MLRLTLHVVILYLLIVGSEPTSWINLGSQMYYINTEDTVNWYGATNACARVGIALLALETKEESDQLKEYLKSSGQNIYRYWTSANDYEHNEHFANAELKSEDRIFTWSSVGTRLSYINWGKGEPNNHGKRNEQCVIVELDFAWDDHHCFDKYNYICESIRVNGYLIPTNWKSYISSAADQIYIMN